MFLCLKTVTFALMTESLTSHTGLDHNQEMIIMITGRRIQASLKYTIGSSNSNLFLKMEQLNLMSFLSKLCVKLCFYVPTHFTSCSNTKALLSAWIF